MSPRALISLAGVTVVFACFVRHTTAQTVFDLSSSDARFDVGAVAFPAEWEFTTRHDLTVAARSAGSVGWEVASTRLPASSAAAQSWGGVGWFRLMIGVDATSAEEAIGIRVMQYGASEIYVDGVLIHRLGVVSADPHEFAAAPNPPPLPLRLTAGEHELAIRYANPIASRLHAVGYDAGFTIVAGDLSRMIETHAGLVRTATIVQIGLTGMYVVFGLLHLFFFAFYPQIRENLFFAIVAFSIALISYNNFQESFFFSGPSDLILVRRFWSGLAITAVLAFMRFVYAVFEERPPSRFGVIVGLGLALGTWGFVNPTVSWWPPGGRTYAYVFALLMQAEIARLAVVAVLRRREGSITMAVAVATFVVAFSYPVVVTLGLAQPIVNLLFFSNFVILGLLLAVSVYLSRRFARTNHRLREKLDEVARLSHQKLEQERKAHEQALEHQKKEAEYRVKLQELEEARALQLSMLPTAMPRHPRLEIAAHMQTATEVGGDYYDFSVGNDGALTVAVGDATGHGIRAGTMVTATKSLFNALGHEPSLLSIFDKSTRALKRMNMRQLYMALTLARFDGDALFLATAGMPPTLIYDSSRGVVDTVPLKGMPLGSFVDFPYTEEEVALSPGDTVLFMSDGFPELFNGSDDMLGYERSVELFAEVADRSPDAIVEHLLAAGEAWTSGRPPGDDMTFVVVRVRSEPTSGDI